MRTVTTVIIIESEIVNESKLKNGCLTIKSGDHIPHSLNGDVEYKFESESCEEIKNYWDNLDKTEKISCIDSCIDSRIHGEAKNLLDVIIEKKENAC